MDGKGWGQLMLGVLLVFSLLSDLSMGVFGLKVDGFSSRIVRGSETDSTQWPFIVRLKTVFDFTSERPETKETSSCSGVLIRPKWVLTAAHCLWWVSHEPPFSRDVQSFLFMGEHLREEPDSGQRRVYRSKVILAQNYFLHPCYDRMKRTSAIHDIALIKLEDDNLPDIKEPNIGLVSLPKDHTSAAPRTECVAIGWGRTQDNKWAKWGSRLPQVMGRTPMTILTPNQCILLKRIGVDRRDISYYPKANVCARNEEGSGIASGDSGGPLLCPEKGLKQGKPVVKWVVVGVLSYGDFYGDNISPANYIRVSSSLKWIRDTITNY